MVTASRTDGAPQMLSAGVRKTIQSIKEIVGNHSDIDIYWTLKENNMDPNETTQKLLNQGAYFTLLWTSPNFFLGFPALLDCFSFIFGQCFFIFFIFVPLICGSGVVLD